MGREWGDPSGEAFPFELLLNVHPVMRDRAPPHLADLQGRHVMRGGTLLPPAPKLPGHLLRNARLLPDRLDILPLLPKGGVVVEVGVAFGHFSKWMIEICAPSRFIAIDLFDLHRLPAMWGRSMADWLEGKDHFTFYRDKFRPLIEAGRMELLRGDSAEMLATLPDGSVDILYLDADHTLEAVRRDLAAAAPKLKPDGILIANDYTMLEAGLSNAPYGVIHAVNEFMISQNWEMIYFALQNYMYCDVALRRAGREGEEASPPPVDVSAYLTALSVQEELWGEVKALRARIATLERHLAAIETSRSWRLTGPLRGAGRWLRRLRRGRAAP